MSTKEELKELTISLYQQENEIFKGPLKKVPKSISEDSVDEVKVHGEANQLVATMDYYDLAALMGEVSS